MNRIIQQIKLYLSLPEMRLFWYFLPFILIIAIIDVFYLPAVWILISLGILIILASIIFINNLRSATLNLEIKIERNQLKSIITNLLDGIIAYDENFRILIFNKESEQIFNLKSEEALSQIFTPDLAKEPKFFLISQVLFPSLAPVVIRRTEGGIYPQVIDMSFSNPKVDLRVTTDKIIDSNGRLLGFVKIVHDRTRELGILKSKSEFIEVAAHQLRTPLTSINWIFEELLNENLTEGQKEMAAMGKVATSTVLKTVNDLLDVSQIEEGRYGYKFQNIDITSFTEGILDDILPTAKQAGIKVYLKKPELPINISADPQKLSIAVSNLIVNAIKYNTENGEVIVEIKKVEDKPYVQISVKDTGIGIPSDDIKNLFTKFFRADNAQKSVTDGTGLGLYITKNVINRHGGEIWAESQMNRGTTFYFTLPLDPNLMPQVESVFLEE